MELSSRIVGTVANNYDKLLYVFDRMVQSGDDDDTVNRADGFLKDLEDFEFVFMLLTYNQVLAETDVVFSILQHRTADVVFCKARVNALLSFITEKTSEVSFCAIYEKAVDMTYDPAQNPRKRHRGPDPKERYKGVYMAVLNKLIDQITTRFANIENQGFSSTAQFSFISRNVSWIPFQLRHLTAC